MKYYMIKLAKYLSYKTMNEVRKEEGLPPVAGGDSILVASFKEVELSDADAAKYKTVNQLRLESGLGVIDDPVINQSLVEAD